MQDMSGKVVVVTGATSGIGRVTAIELGRAGAEVVLVVRDAHKGADVARAVAQAGGRGRVVVCDLTSIVDVKRAAGELLRMERIDVLVNNAGNSYTERALTPEGLERTWALNHLAYMALTLELLPLLETTAKAHGGARIVNVASAMHRRAKLGVIGETGPGEGELLGVLHAYSRSKLGNVLFTHALARRLEGTGVTVNALHPGVIASGMGRDMHGFLGFAWNKIVRRFALSVEEGAKPTLMLATAPELADTNGAYFDRTRRVDSSKASRDVTLQERVWEASLAQIARVSGVAA